MDPSRVTDEDIALLEAALEQRLRKLPPPKPSTIWQRTQTRYEIGGENGCISHDCDEPHWELLRIRHERVFVFEARRRLDNHELCDVWTPMTPEERSRTIRDLLTDRLHQLIGHPEIEESDA